ncbi:MAG TPA: hypothetical protein VGQ52_07450, partial [Gemmatimonadaceae bacterium]|nr:hypothetical protein [Gemmatimonadaceae bacterium]
MSAVHARHCLAALAPEIMVYRLRLLGIALIALSASTCTFSSNGTQSPLTSVINDAWEFEKRENPLFATTTDDHRYDAELPSMTPTNLARR